MSTFLHIHCASIEIFFRSAVSEVTGTPLPYDDVLYLRDRMWEISPSLVRYDVTEPTTSNVTLLGLNYLTSLAAAKSSKTPFGKPITNFYQTDVISRAYVLQILDQ